MIKRQYKSRWHPHLARCVDSRHSTDKNRNDGEKTSQWLETNKRKRKRKQSLETMERSFQRLSISRFDRNQVMNKKIKFTENNTIELASSINIETNAYSFRRIDYLKLSDDQFKSLLKMFDMNMNHQLLYYLNDKQSLDFIRRYTSMMDELLFFELEQDQWNYYYKIGVEQNIWSKRFSRKWAKMNSTVHSIGRSKDSIDNHRQHLEREIVRVKNDLVQLKMEMFSLFTKKHQQTEMNRKCLNDIILNCIRQHQQHLHRHSKWKQHLFMLDLEDHRIIEEFYHHKPNKQQIRCVQMIWRYVKEKINVRTTMNLIKYHLDRKCLSDKNKSHYSSSIFDDIKFIFDMKVSMYHWKKMIRLTFEVLNVYQSFGHRMLNSIQQKIDKEKEIFIEASDNVTTISNNLLKIVEQREEHMYQRAVCIQHEKISMFFDRNTLLYENSFSFNQ